MGNFLSADVVFKRHFGLNNIAYFGGRVLRMNFSERFETTERFPRNSPLPFIPFLAGIRDIILSMKGAKVHVPHILLLALLILGLASCGSGQNLETTPDRSIRIITSTPRNTAAPTITPTPLVPVLDAEDLQGVEIEFWYVWDPTIPDVLDEIAGQFNQDNPEGIEVVSRRFSHPADFETAMQEAIANQTPPNVALAHPYEYNAWLENDVLVDLAPYLQNPGYGLTEEELAQFYPPMLARDRYGSERRGFPGLISARVLLYNQTWAQELGFNNPPTSAAGFTQQACTAHDANGDRTGGWMIDTSPGSATAWLLAFTGGLESGSRYTFDSEAVVAAYTFLSELRGAGCAWQPTDAYPDQAFVDRLGLFYPVSTREIGYVQQAFDLSESADQWTAIAYPNDLAESRVSFYGTSYVILDSSIEEQIAAWLFIRAMTSTQNQLHLAETNLTLPLSREASAMLQEEQDLPRPWLDALNLLDQAVTEPRFASWGVVRGVVQDALTEVMDERFDPGTISLFLNQLNDLVAELHQ